MKLIIFSLLFISLIVLCAGVDRRHKRRTHHKTKASEFVAFCDAGSTKTECEIYEKKQGATEWVACAENDDDKPKSWVVKKVTVNSVD